MVEGLLIDRKSGRYVREAIFFSSDSQSLQFAVYDENQYDRITIKKKKRGEES